VSTFFFVVCGSKLIKNYYSGWLIFYTAGALPRNQSNLKNYFLCSNLLLLDLQVCLTASILWLQYGLTDWTQVQMIGILIGFFSSIIWYATGGPQYLNFENQSFQALEYIQS
jgi:hypothetical protein